jgi:hypothetical protein
VVGKGTGKNRERNGVWNASLVWKGEAVGPTVWEGWSASKRGG